jgi:hypothetical protein
MERTVKVEVAKVAELAREYARLGLPIRRQSRHEAQVELPCGVVLVLSRRVSPRPALAA